MINNGYSNKDVTKSIALHLEQYYNPRESQTPQAGQRIKLYYRAYMNTQYRRDEQALRKIITDCVKPIDSESSLALTIYYKNKKTHNLILRNNPNPDVSALQRSHLVYEYTCTTGNCAALPNSYIGMTTTRLSRRLTLHLANGAPKKHTEETHRAKLTREMIVEGTKILYYNNDHRRLQILEALTIKEKNPSMNSQIHDNYVIPTNRSFDPRIKLVREN